MSSWNPPPYFCLWCDFELVPWQSPVPKWFDYHNAAREGLQQHIEQVHPDKLDIARPPHAEPVRLGNYKQYE